MREQVRTLNTRAETAEKRAESLENVNQMLRKQIETSNDNIDDMDSTLRRPCLVVSNIPENTTKSDEDQFIELCNEKLSLQEQITKQDIANASRLKRKGRTETRSSKPAALVIRFQNEKARDRVFSNKSKLKGSGKVISEFLTPRKSALLKECHEKIPGSFRERSIWTHFGKVLVKKHGDSTKTFEIKCSNDITKFLTEHNLTARESTDTT